MIDLTDAPAVPARRRPAVPAPQGEPEPRDLVGGAGTGDRFTDAVGIVRVHETISAAQLATQLRALGWQLSDRTASRILLEVQEHLMRVDPWPLSTP